MDHLFHSTPLFAILVFDKPDWPIFGPSFKVQKQHENKNHQTSCFGGGGEKSLRKWNLAKFRKIGLF